MNPRPSPPLLLLATLLLVTVVPASAQTAYGTILGVITDATSAAIPGAEVRVTNQGTNVSSDVSTGADGGYAVTRLIPGLYRVEVTFDRAFPPGRARLNCTVPAGGGRWHWFGLQFVVP